MAGMGRDGRGRTTTLGSFVELSDAESLCYYSWQMGETAPLWWDGRTGLGLFKDGEAMLVFFILSVTNSSLGSASPVGFGWHWGTGFRGNFPEAQGC